jgi:hypothetical protein
MAVGTIASLSVSASTTSIAISFAKPANCTKVIFTLTPKNPSGSNISKTYTLPAGSTGTQLIYNFTGLISTQKYTLFATPYNGSTAGTARIYYNSNSDPINSIKMPNAKITTAQTQTSYNSLTGTVGGVGGAVGTGSSTGSTANGGTIKASDAAGSNTPQFVAGVTDAVVPSDLNAPGRISIKVTDLAPNQTYAIKVRAYTTDSQGNKVHSEYSSPIYITAPGFSASGTNHLSTNSNGDLQLLGGSIFAGDFGSDAGLIDVVNGTTTGTGVILNKTGLAGFASGTKEFYIDAATGNAYFAGTIGATIIQSTNYSPSIAISEPKYTVAGTQIDLNNGSISSETFRIDPYGNAYFAGNISGNATIGTTLASTVVSNAAAGANSATYAYSAVQPGQFFKVDNSNQVVTVDTTGINITSSATASANGTSRIEMTNGYFTAYANNIPTFQIQASSGNVFMTGKVTATEGYIGSEAQGWQINSDNIASRTGNLVLKASDGSISGGTITGSLFKTSSNPTRIEIGTINSSTNKYDNINFWTEITSGSRAEAGRIVVGGYSNVPPNESTATLVISAPNFDKNNTNAAMISMTSYSISSYPKITLTGDLTLTGEIVSNSDETKNGLRGIKAQNGGSATGGNNGDIILIY